MSYFQAESPNLALKQFGESLYDNLLFFAPSAESFSTLGFDDFVEFVQEGGNILLAANRKVSDSIRDFLESFGVSLDKKDTEVIDHFEREDSLDTR